MAAAPGLFLGIDVGTQGVKALVVDAACGTVVARATEPLQLLEGLPPGHAEQHPADWLRAVAAAGRRAVQAAPAPIAGIGVAGQQHGAVLLDGSGAVVRPAKLWCDTATAAEAAELSARLGRSIPAGFTASKLLWVRRHEAANWARTATVLLPHDYVNWWLTGVAAMEFGDASGTGWFDPVARCFDPAAIAAIDPRLAALLPPLLEPGSLAGRLTAAAAAALGLEPGIPVAAGGGDNMMSAIGSGATTAGVVVMSLGTSATIFTRCAAPLVDPTGRIAAFCSSDGGWLPLACTMNGTGVAAEVCQLTGGDHEQLTAAAAEVPAGALGLVWLPFLVGERLPDLPLVAGTLTGIRAGSLRPAVLYRAALEGVAAHLGHALDCLGALGIRPTELRVTGGGARNSLWRQILADVLDLPVRALVESESAALGAALQAHWAVRRAAGERELSCHEVAAPAVRVTEPLWPDPASRAAATALRQQWRSALGRLHPGAG